jgi:hypothetical protein
MCGIMGYLGGRDTVEVLLEGLRRLEYRGYDSAGVAVLVDGKVEVVKAKGKISVLTEVLEGKKPEGSVGIAHTRWATHGPPSKKNAHPHPDCEGHIAVVHNGIIENYLELREKLQAEGHKFRSETDTETLAHLFEKYYDGDLEKAVRRGLKEVKGSYAVVAISDRDPGVLIAARQYSPLIVGLGEKPGENFVASDPSAILSFTRKAYLIDNGEMVVLTKDRVEVKTLAGKAVKKPVFHIEWDAEMAEKGGHKHFMIKEIFEQPHALRETIGERIAGGEAALKLEGLNLTDAYLRRVKKVAIIACGTASYAGMAGQYALEKLCGVPVMVDVASELQHRECVFDKDTLGIAISQSGETADTLQAMRMARAAGDHECDRELGGAGVEWGALHPRGAGDRGGLDEGVYEPDNGDAAVLRAPGRGARSDQADGGAATPAGNQTAAGSGGGVSGGGGGTCGGAGEEVQGCDAVSVPGPRGALLHGDGGGAEDQRDRVSGRGGVRGGGDEARSAGAGDGRGGGAFGGGGGAALSEVHRKPPGDSGARGQGDRGGERGG